MPFAELGLGPEIMAGVEELDWNQPTPIQEQAIPYALEGRDVLACAQTGTGKTGAFVLPVLQRIPHTGHIRALIVTPTRELANQIDTMARGVARHTHHAVTAVYGGMKYGTQIKRLTHGVDVLVATPGRLLDLHGKGVVDLSAVEILVLDEADRMLDMGFWPDVRKILRLLPVKRQNMLFSATLSGDVNRLIGDTLTDPVTIQISLNSSTVEGVAQQLYPVNASQKTEMLVALLKQTDEYRAMIFTRTKRRADRLTEALNSSGVEAAVIHSDLSQQKRTETLDAFRSGKHSLLVSTDVTARGIDIEGVTHVINYDVPETPDDYIHRIGRTARAGETGIAITLMGYEEMPFLRDIERVTGMTLENHDVDGFEYQDRVVPDEDRSAKDLKPRSLYSGGVMQRGGRKRTRRF